MQRSRHEGKSLVPFGVLTGGRWAPTGELLIFKRNARYPAQVEPPPLGKLSGGTAAARLIKKYLYRAPIHSEYVRFAHTQIAAVPKMHDTSLDNCPVKFFHVVHDFSDYAGDQKLAYVAAHRLHHTPTGRDR